MMACDELTMLEHAFNILKSHRCRDVTFHEWVILTASSNVRWDALVDELASTKPMRVCGS